MRFYQMVQKKRVRGMELVDINLEYKTVYELLKRKGV